MDVGEVARRLTGFSDKQFREYEIPRVVSRKQLGKLRGVRPRSSVRILLNLVTTSEDVDAERRAFLRNPRAYLHNRRRAALRRLATRGEGGR